MLPLQDNEVEMLIGRDIICPYDRGDGHEHHVFVKNVFQHDMYPA